MAIVDTDASKWYVPDQDEDQFIGLQLPIILDNGQEASTRTTMEAVKQNLLNLLNTERGERPMQPNLGVGLRRKLFEPYSEEMVVDIQDIITQSVNYWLPFLSINWINVNMSDSERNTLNVEVNFNLKKDPTTAESVQITIGE